MRSLFVVHIGETQGHLVRALAIADELYSRGVSVEIACSDSGKWLLESWHVKYKHHSLIWPFSHNSMTIGKPSEFLCNRVKNANAQLLHILQSNQPDIVIGCPGIFSAQVAYSLGIHHVSVLHGPYLSQIIQLDNPSVVESAVISFSNAFFNNCVNYIYQFLSDSLNLVNLTYNEYLRSERIFIPQLFLPLPKWPNLNVTPFISASFGPSIDVDGTDLKKSCYITFGSGNPCDIESIVHAAESVFPRVIVSSGLIKVRPRKSTTICQPFIASASLAGRVSSVISHGGIGTVGTFAEFGTSQLIIPTEVDQATMAVQAGRSGIATSLGLKEWACRPSLGRKMRDVPEQEMLRAIIGLAEAQRGNCIDASGARYISESIVNESLSALGIQRSSRIL